MPAKTQKQQRMMQVAYAIKKGEASAKKYPRAAKVAKGMSKTQLRDFAKGKRKGKPKRAKKKK